MDSSTAGSGALIGELLEDLPLGRGDGVRVPPLRRIGKRHRGASASVIAAAQATFLGDHSAMPLPAISGIEKLRDTESLSESVSTTACTVKMPSRLGMTVSV